MRERIVTMGFVLLITTALLLAAVDIIDIVERSSRRPPCEAPKGFQPPQLDCDTDESLWDCVRNAHYRRDI